MYPDRDIRAVAHRNKLARRWLFFGEEDDEDAELISAGDRAKGFPPWAQLGPPREDDAT